VRCSTPEALPPSGTAYRRSPSYCFGRTDMWLLSLRWVLALRRSCTAALPVRRFH